MGTGNRLATQRRVGTVRLLLGIALLAVACSGRRVPSPLELQRIELQEAPLWNAAAAWDEAEDHLILLDPGGHRLLVFDLDGRLTRSVDLDAVAALDYANPVRLLRSGDGFLLGDRRYLVRFDARLVPVGVSDVFRELAGAGLVEGSLGDFVVVGGELIAFADFRGSGAAEEGWERGFVRIDLAAGAVDVLRTLPLASPEFARYYYYDRRPFLASEGRSVFLLRLTDPAALERVGSRGLVPLAPVGEGERTPVGLYGRGGRLFVLLARRKAGAVAPMRVEAQPLSQGAEAHLEVMEVVGQGPREWVLQRRGDSGRRVESERLLPSESDRLVLVPGRRSWALVEETPKGDAGGRAAISVLLVPTAWIEGSP